MICVKAVAVLLSPEPRHAMYRSSNTAALLAMFAALGVTALLAPAWCALSFQGWFHNPKPNLNLLQRQLMLAALGLAALLAPAWCAPGPCGARLGFM